ncbi:MAG: hypothetical protein J0L94_08245 [Rhodothermia bacterium]|nr:hypothetical protein [Rhodothermia bacterium]
MQNGIIRRVNHLERPAFVTELPPTLLGRTFGETRFFRQAIRRGRLMAVLTVQVQARTKVINLRPEGGVLDFQ